MIFIFQCNDSEEKENPLLRIQKNEKKSGYNKNWSVLIRYCIIRMSSYTRRIVRNRRDTAKCIPYPAFAITPQSIISGKFFLLSRNEYKQ